MAIARPNAMRTGYCGNIYRRVTYLEKAGQITNGHKHNFDHMMLVHEGDVRVEATLLDGTKVDRIFGRSSPFGDWCLIKAGVEHKITAACDGVLYYCIYSIRTPDGEVVEQDTGWHEATV